MMGDFDGMPDGQLRNAILAARGMGATRKRSAELCEYYAKRLPELLAEAERRGLNLDDVPYRRGQAFLPLPKRHGGAPSRRRRRLRRRRAREAGAT